MDSLTYKRTNVYETADETLMTEIFDFAEGYKHFLDHAREAGFSVKDITFSPITGPEGNIEYLGWLGTEGEGPVWSGDLRELVEESHRSLQGKEGQP